MVESGTNDPLAGRLRVGGVMSGAATWATEGAAVTIAPHGKRSLSGRAGVESSFLLSLAEVAPDVDRPGAPYAASPAFLSSNANPPKYGDALYKEEALEDDRPGRGREVHI